MILVTGWNNDADGIAFLAQTDDPAEAFRLLLESWNAESTERFKLVTANEGNDPDCPKTVLLWEDIPDEEVIEQIEGYGDVGGWALVADPIEIGKVMRRMPW